MQIRTHCKKHGVEWYHIKTLIMAFDQCLEHSLKMERVRVHGLWKNEHVHLFLIFF